MSTDFDAPSRCKIAGMLLASLVCALGALGNVGWGQDRVMLRGGSGIGAIVEQGRVLDWTGTELQLEAENGAIRKMNAKQVESVDTVRLETHVAGMRFLAEGKLDEAKEELLKALADEPRVWMRREILAELVRADLALGNRGGAATHFLALYLSDPETMWWNRIPLDWGWEPPSSTDASLARNWIRPTESPVSQLMGASILLFDPSESALAQERLKRLAVSTDRRVYSLARAQQWRLRLKGARVSEGEVKIWLDRLEEVPESLRGGAHFLIGHGYASAAKPEQAAVHWLWLPLVHDEDPRLAAEAEVLAAEQLMQIGRAGDAVVLYREVVERFGYTPARAVAEKALAELTSKPADRSDVSKRPGPMDDPKGDPMAAPTGVE